MAVRAQDQVTVVDLTDAYSIMLSMDAVSLNGDISTLGTATSVVVNVSAFRGTDQLTPTVGTPTCPSNVTASVGTASNKLVPVTINFAAALNTAGQVVIPVSVNDVTISKSFAFSISFKGQGGTNATAYTLLYSAAAINKANDGTYTPTSITLTAKSQTGTSAPANYAGRFKIESTTNGTSWTSVYTSSSNEATKTQTVPANITALRCSLYMAGGTSTLLDQVVIPVTLNGTDGNDGNDAIAMEIISSAGTIFKNTSIATTLTAHVFVGGEEVTGDALAALGTIKWYKDGGSTAVATGATLTISAGDVTDKAVYEARLED